MAKSVSVYVDGFNLYHALDDLGEDHLKWLDLFALGKTLLREDGSEVLTTVKYFSAYAKWREDSYRRHQRYVGALQAHDVTVILGRFKEKQMRCRACGRQYKAHEEKETDVNIGAHLMADALQSRFDRAIVVSADTDLNGVVEHARRESGKLIQVAAPPDRKGRNREAAFEVTRGRVKRSLLPALIEHEGKRIERPVQYMPPSEG